MSLMINLKLGELHVALAFQSTTIVLLESPELYFVHSNNIEPTMSTSTLLLINIQYVIRLRLNCTTVKTCKNQLLYREVCKLYLKI